MYYGWLQDSIWDLTESQWEAFGQFPFALVTCVDSTVDVKSTTTAKKIVESDSSCGYIGRSLLVGDARIVDVARRYQLFSHFDEVWLYKERPTADKPGAFSIVAPLDLNNDPLPEGLLKWFIVSGCILGLGDGIGMNYATTQKWIVDSLRERR